MGCHILPVSPPAASGQRCVVVRTYDDGRCFNIEGAHFGGIIFDIVDARLRRALVEGGGSKLVFRDENPGLILDWIRHRRPLYTCNFSFLKALSRICLFSLCFCLLP